MLVYLKEFRKAYNLTQKEAAESIGIDQRQWSRYENETNEFPIRYLKDLCLKYNVSADFLLGLDKVKSRPDQTQTYEIKNTMTGESATMYIAGNITINDK